MKSTNSQPNSAEKVYPYLGIYNQGGFVLMFTEPGKGFVVWSDGSIVGRKVGYFMDSAAEFAFSPFTGQITLEN